METIKGRLQSVGSATIIQNTINVYNTLEINGRMFQRIKASRAMGDILSGSLGEEISIWIIDNEIAGIQKTDGKCYAMHNPNRPGIFSLIFGICMIGAWGLGLVLLWKRNKEIIKANEFDLMHANLPGASVFSY